MSIIIYLKDACTHQGRISSTSRFLLEEILKVQNSYILFFLLVCWESTDFVGSVLCVSVNEHTNNWLPDVGLGIMKILFLLCGEWRNDHVLGSQQKVYRGCCCWVLSCFAPKGDFLHFLPSPPIFYIRKSWENGWATGKIVSENGYERKLEKFQVEVEALGKWIESKKGEQRGSDLVTEQEQKEKELDYKQIATLFCAGGQKALQGNKVKEANWAFKASKCKVV